MDSSQDKYLHLFDNTAGGIQLPSAFTYPFHYFPHPLTQLAAKQVQAYLQSRSDWHEEISKGKMFGVLIVRTAQGETGFLAAFSGNLAGSDHHDYFVPPIYDMLQPDGFFRIEEANISEINHRIAQAEHDEDYLSAKQSLRQTEEDAAHRLAEYKQMMKESKAAREEKRRSNTLTPEEEKELIKESQFQKAECKRLEKQLKEEVSRCADTLKQWTDKISAWKAERKQRSAALQQKLFEQFRILNAKGEEKDICQIFAETTHTIPPAGTGECALPKMLQYAYQHNMQPLAMGEFWQGVSPKDEIRHDGCFYPSCKSKCAPILSHALIGLNVEKNPLQDDKHRDSKLDIIYEDEWIVAVNKPAGMLSVPGKDGLASVLERLQELYPDSDSPLLVHRLDMDTSGILLAAKTKEIHQRLQELFATREIKKRYTALLDGCVEADSGMIRLPLCLNPDDRPRQMVNHELGKPAVTRYQVIHRTEQHTLVSFFPLTGRTHQLRVHAAHPEGLHCPIIGDNLYGKPADRLYLHAAQIEFVHPVTQVLTKIVCEADF